MPAIDFSKDAENNKAEDNMVKDNAVILSAFYKENEVKLIYRGDKKIFESKRLYTTFIAEKDLNNSSDQCLRINHLSNYGKITELYINGVSYDVDDVLMPIQIQIQTRVNVKIKGHFTVQGSDCDMHNFFVADGLEFVVNVGNAMFRDCTGITDLDLTHFNTSAVGSNSNKQGNMQDLFAGCRNLKTVNINNFDMTNISHVNSMFNGCENLTRLDISGWKNTNNITTTGHMFKGCNSLESVYLPQLPSLINMESMFYKCTNLKEIDMSGINSSSLEKVGSALLYVPNTCTVIVNSGFYSKFEPGDLSWGGTFTIR